MPVQRPGLPEHWEGVATFGLPGSPASLLSSRGPSPGRDPHHCPEQAPLALLPVLRSLLRALRSFLWAGVPIPRLPSPRWGLS
ncbi:hypothetical protein NDU88_010103 [Pleurodeles waltl]|uniref:Uncharacterized protein n=1 Tax=Pleurodeles waltl TaxID=8319 RepID=A0AAV7S0W9_PLEWA|nr:hypothetical protein NDU88_010103 [Pleurodeles waltl]